MKSLPNGVILLSIASLLTDVASEAIYPLLPIYLTTVLHAPALSLGLIEGLAEATASLLRLGSGIWADRLGHSKLLTFCGYSLSNLSRPLLALAQSWPHMLVLRWTDRVGKGIRGAPRDAWLAKMATKETVNTVYGFHRGMDHTGALLGPLWASAFLLAFPGDYRSLFLWTLVPGVLSVIAILSTREYGKRAGKKKTEWRLNLWWELPKPLKIYLAILLVFSLGNASDTFILLRLQQQGVPVAWIPALWAGFHVVKMLFSFGSGPLADHFGRKPLIIAGWLVFAVSYLAFGFTEDKTQLLALFLAYGAFHGLTEGPERALVARLAPENVRGAAFGFQAMVMGLAALPASFFFGAVWTGIHASAAFFLSALSATAAALLLWLYLDEP